MAEKKNQECISEVQTKEVDKSKMDKVDKGSLEKAAQTLPMPVPTVTVPVAPVRVTSVPIFTKTPPNDLYRRLLPAVLFLLTFVTVMTLLLIYMDTVALGAQQFRLNMSRDYELASIPQDSPSLVQYVRQLHLTPRRQQAIDDQPIITKNVAEVLKVFGDDYNGTFVEILPSGPRDPSALYLERSGWHGVAARASPRDYLALRAATSMHAGLAAADHPREVAYPASGTSAVSSFSSRVLCLPLYTMLLAAELTTVDYCVLGGEHTLAALKVLPFQNVLLKIIDIRSTDSVMKNGTTEFLKTKNYTVLATFDDSIMYRLKENIA